MNIYFMALREYWVDVFDLSRTLIKETYFDMKVYKIAENIVNRYNILYIERTTIIEQLN